MNRSTQAIQIGNTLFPFRMIECIIYNEKESKITIIAKGPRNYNFYPKHAGIDDMRLSISNALLRGDGFIWMEEIDETYRMVGRRACPRKTA